MVNRFLTKYACRHVPATTKGVRGDLLTAWRHCAELGFVDHPNPRAVQIHRVPQGIPDCYTVDEVRQLVRDSSRLQGCFGGLPRADYMATLIRLGWESGLRLGDCWAVSAKQLHGDKLVRVSSKSGIRTVHTVSLALREGLGRLGHLRWPLSRASFAPHFQIVRDMTVRRGSFKWLRRASGSYVAAYYGEASGASHLGHTNLATFRRYYDHRLVEGVRPMPPILD